MYKYLILLFVVLLFVSCDPNNPRVPSRYKEWKIFHSNVDMDDPDYPIEVLEDRYRFTYGHLNKENGIKYVDWEWEYKIKNISKKIIYEVKVWYILKDKYDVELDKSLGLNRNPNYSMYSSNPLYIEIKPGDTYTIKQESSMEYRFMRKVEYRTWTISYRFKE